MDDSDDRAFDIILWGATSFVGKLTAEYLMARHGAGGGVRWAIGGRSQSRLDAVKDGLGAGAADLPTVVGDAHDPAFLGRMARQTKVVATTVGPYMSHGKDLVAACAAAGTDYCDLTGEIPFIREMRDRHADAARASGARIVQCCGFDSIPSDLGVFFLDRAARERHGRGITSVSARVQAIKGGLSGGTVASFSGSLNRARKDPDIARMLRTPYALCPPGRRDGPQQPKWDRVSRDRETRSWLAPFLMAPVNTRVVHATNAILDYPYTAGFLYDERMVARSAVEAYAIRAGLYAALGALSIPMTRSLLTSIFLPKPGEGPSRAAREAGFFDIRFHGRCVNGEPLAARVTGDRDPGYGSTSKMFGEAALCLARDIPRDAVPGGFWTPASAMGHHLVDRLVAHSGLTFEIIDGA